MHPKDLAEERKRRTRKAKRKLAVDFRQCALHATPDELRQLKQLTRLVRLDIVTAEDAHSDIKKLWAIQDVRLKEAAALRQQNERSSAHVAA